MHSWMARAFFRVHERLLGRGTFSVLRQLEQSQWWPQERIRALQLERLQGLVASAWAHCPYWRTLMERHGIAPESIRSLDDVRRFPFLEKPAIRASREEMVWRNEGPRIRIARTTGSTNASLEFYTSASREAQISAARMRGHASVGIRPGDREMYFWAAPVELKAQSWLRHVRDMLRNDGFTNALELTPELVPQHVQNWRLWRPQCIFGYVCSFVVLARMAQHAGVDLTVLRDCGLRAIVTTSELLGEENRRLISEAFGVPVYDSYGLREGGLVGHECSHQTMHTNDEQLLLEVIDPRTLEPADGEGELVLTFLGSRVMPIIRYRTGDMVTLVRERCPCGRSLGGLRMTGGRLTEFLVTGDGRWISGAVFMYVVKETPGILQLQVRQERLGRLRVLLARDKDFPPDGVERVQAAIRRRIGGHDEIAIEMVEEIPPCASGKQRLVISEVSRQMMESRVFTPQQELGGGDGKEQSAGSPAVP